MTLVAERWRPAWRLRATGWMPSATPSRPRTCPGPSPRRSPRRPARTTGSTVTGSATSPWSTAAAARAAGTAAGRSWPRRTSLSSACCSSARGRNRLRSPANGSSCAPGCAAVAQRRTGALPGARAAAQMDAARAGGAAPVGWTSGGRLLDPAAVGLLTALLGTTMRSAAALGGRSGMPIADAAVDLLAGALPGPRPGEPSEDATWWRVTAHVQRHLRDPGLTPGRWRQRDSSRCARLRPRRAGRPARYVRRRRLDAAHRDWCAWHRGELVESAHGGGSAIRPPAGGSRIASAAHDLVRRAGSKSLPARDGAELRAGPVGPAGRCGAQ